ncbi:tyrosine-type recombinase/integrase [Dendronalium phyllosphericum]|uniref:tyrosine-type recombinase/integrase n=1 Tax=Dendronalium phyllosphericum TaxID=2840445 RepID=UPI001CEC1035|nr:tyrosine-type recombinase/integrase [Dendronalium phyllosphericum]
MWLVGLSQTTREQYRRDIRQFRAFAKLVDFRTISPLTFIAYAQHLEQTYAVATTRRKLASLSSFCSFAVRLGFLTANPMVAVRKPKASTTLAGKTLTQQQVFRMLDRTEDTRNRCMLKVLYSLGLRVSEAVGLRWSDFTEVNATKITVSVFGKGGKYRTLVLPLSVWKELTELRTTQQHNGVNDYVFQSYSNRHRKQSGKQLDRCNASKIVKACAIAVGLTSLVSAHFLRHACASHSLANGASIQLVKETLGHANISTTNWYLEANPDDCASLYLNV